MATMESVYTIGSNSTGMGHLCKRLRNVFATSCDKECMSVVYMKDRVRQRRNRKAMRLGISASAIGVAALIGWSAPASVSALVSANAPPMQSVNFPICSSGKRHTCIVDGDTFWLDGEKFRLSGFNAPEMSGYCQAERDKARLARTELRRLLSQPFSLERTGFDRYGRTLAIVRTAEGDISDAMVGAGLAHIWRGHKENWC